MSPTSITATGKHGVLSQLDANRYGRAPEWRGAQIASPGSLMRSRGISRAYPWACDLYAVTVVAVYLRVNRP
jgi:hypothetical protein